MSLTPHTDSKIIYLQIKNFSLWQEIKKPVQGCEEIEVKNPKTGEMLKKSGYRFDSVGGRATKLVKYDTEKKYPTRYFGFKLHIADGSEVYVLDMPYNSQILRRFLHVARNIDWGRPFSISAFKGKKSKGDGDALGVWFQQGGETVKPYYTREQPHGMPEAIFDSELQQWDFKAQHRWLVDRLKNETIPDIEAAAALANPPVEPERGEQQEEEPQHSDTDFRPSDFIVDDDIPF